MEVRDKNLDVCINYGANEDGYLYLRHAGAPQRMRLAAGPVLASSGTHMSI
jgi:hypothetical protein